MTEVLDGAPVVFLPCVVVENLFHRFLLALGEKVADVIKTSREAGVNLYLRGRAGASGASGASSGTPVSDISSMRLGPGVGVAASVSSGAALHSLIRSVSPVAGRSQRAETSWDTKAVDPKAAPAWRRCTMGCSCSATSGSWAGRIFSRSRRLRCSGAKAASPYLKSCASSADSSFSWTTRWACWCS